MKIAELFVALGFQVEGGDVLPNVEKQLDSAAGKAGKLAAGIDVITAGLLYMVDTAVNAAVGLSKFSLSTGLSTTELQQWQHTAAVANVSAAELTATVTELWKTGSRLMLGGGSGATPWLLLGINPNMDPFEMLKQLHVALQNITPERLAAFSVIAEQAHLSSDMFQMLRQKNLPIDALKQQYLLLGQNQEKLMRVNREWNTLKDEATRTKNIFSAEMAPALSRVLEYLLKVVDQAAQFVHWLNGGSPAADLLRNALQVLGVGIAVLGGILTTFAVAAKGFSIALGVVNVASSSLFLTTAGWLAIAAAIALTAKSFYDLTKAIVDYNDATNIKQVGLAPGRFPKGAQGFKDNPAAPNQGVHGAGGQWDPYRPWGPTLGDLLGHDKPRNSVGGSTSTVHIDKIQIDGSKDPKATGKSVVSELMQHLTFAGGNAPAKSY